jgi:hypothetical protein
MVGISRPGFRHDRARRCAALIVDGLLLCEGAGTLYDFARDTRCLATVKKAYRYRLDRLLKGLNQTQAVG